MEGVTYLDNAGSVPYSEVQLKGVFEELSVSVHGNPHSQSSSSLYTTKIIEEARSRVLEFFNADSSEYSVIFTGGTTLGLKMIGELFPWTPHSHFCYAKDSHNSVLGIREYAALHGASLHAFDRFSSQHFFQQFAATSTATSSSVTTATPSSNGSSEEKENEERVNEEQVSGEKVSEEEVYHLVAVAAEDNFSGAKVPLEHFNMKKQQLKGY
jgi:molybdenum cofactor sulfurtransferase